MSGQRDELKVSFWQGSLHLTHLDQGYEPVLEAVDQQRRDCDATVKGHVTYLKLYIFFNFQQFNYSGDLKSDLLNSGLFEGWISNGRPLAIVRTYNF